MSQIGVIKEQGDMGLFFDPITEAEEEQLRKTQKEKEEEKKNKKK